MKTRTLGILAAISVLLAVLSVIYSPVIYAGSFVTTPLTSGGAPTNCTGAGSYACTNAANTFSAGQTLSYVDPILTLDDTSNPGHQVWLENFAGDLELGSTQYGDYCAFGQTPWFACTNALVIGWASNNFPPNGPDTGFSRTGPAAVALGNGSAGNSSGTLALATLSAGTAVTAPNVGNIVAQNTVTGQATSLAATTVYTPPAQGIYEICAGYVVTTAGSVGATLQAGIRFTSSGVTAGPGIGSISAATTVGATGNAGNVSTCQTVLPDGGSNLQVSYTIAGAPTTNPTYTYWYAVTKK